MHLENRCVQVRKQSPSGPRLATFFAIIYYAGLRPEEAVNLRKDKHHPPAARVFADWSDGPLAHLLSGPFPANAAWLALAARRPNEASQVSIVATFSTVGGGPADRSAP